MAKPAPAAFTTLDSTTLAAVHGGRRASSSRSSDDQLLDKLDSIESALKDVGKNTNTGGNAMSQVLPLVALSMMNQQPAQPQQPPVVIVRRGRC